MTHYFENRPEVVATLKRYWNADAQLQQLHDDFIENTISNLHAYGNGPNFVINSGYYSDGFEESSVVQQHLWLLSTEYQRF